MNEKMERLQHQLAQKRAEREEMLALVMESGTTPLSLADFRIALYRTILMHARNEGNGPSIWTSRRGHQVHKPTYAADGTIRIKLPSPFVGFLLGVVSASARPGPPLFRDEHESHGDR